MPAGVIHGLNRFKPEGGLNLPTLQWGPTEGRCDSQLFKSFLSMQRHKMRASRHLEGAPNVLRRPWVQKGRLLPSMAHEAVWPSGSVALHMSMFNTVAIFY